MSISGDISKLFILLSIVSIVFSSGCDNLVNTFIDVSDLKSEVAGLASSLGLLMIIIQGLHWIISDQPETRDECKKGIIYVLLALIMVSSADMIVGLLYNPVTK
jgi:choline-glycine betaine transporter